MYKPLIIRDNLRLCCFNFIKWINIIKLENLVFYDGKIKEYISNNIGNGNGVVIYDNYSNLPNDLLEDTIAYCKNDYTDSTDVNNTVVYNSGLYVYILSETKWNYINKEQFEIEEVTEDDIDAWF